VNTTTACSQPHCLSTETNTLLPTPTTNEPLDERRISRTCPDSELRVWNRKGFENRFHNGKIEFFNSDLGCSRGQCDSREGPRAGTQFRRSLGNSGSRYYSTASDRNFRPTDAIVGEDGALYVADWQNVIIGHMQHNIRDPNRDHTHGRILRLTRKGRRCRSQWQLPGNRSRSFLRTSSIPSMGFGTAPASN
jgi:hypothetical protein